jgi:hypothetical protein
MTSDNRPSGISGSNPGGTDSATPPGGTLVIRTWYEPDQEPGFRARLTFSRGPAGEPDTVAAADPAEVLSIVRQWLFAQPGSPDEV